MSPTQVKSTYRKNAQFEEQTTTGILGTVPYKIVKVIEHRQAFINEGKSHRGAQFSVYTLASDSKEWVPVFSQKSREVLISFGFFTEN